MLGQVAVGRTLCRWLFTAAVLPVRPAEGAECWLPPDFGANVPGVVVAIGDSITLGKSSDVCHNRAASLTTPAGPAGEPGAEGVDERRLRAGEAEIEGCEQGEEGAAALREVAHLTPRIELHDAAQSNWHAPQPTTRAADPAGGAQDLRRLRRFGVRHGAGQ
jgi:hypothetical protein